jgi:glycerate kinase
MPRVIVAPDKFKHSLSAAQVAEAVRRGLHAGAEEVDVVRLPVADGGEGTVDSAVAAGFSRQPVTATGPDGEPLHTSFAFDGTTAVIEMAAISGLQLLDPDRLTPLTATSRGTGEVIRAALDRGASRVVLGIGGSASTDGGAGLLQGLGVSLRDAAGDELGPGGVALRDLAALDLSALHPQLAQIEVTVACDVDNPLTGPSGAAAVYGPQKGASAQDVAVLDRGLARFADAVAALTGRDLRDGPGAGAAGGVGFASVSVLGAHLRPGIDVVLELVGFHQHLAEADLVVVGEGSLDHQTLRGKAPVGVARHAQAAGVPVVAVAGRCLLSEAALRAAGIDVVLTCSDLETDPQRSMQNAASLLERLGGQVADLLVHALRR